MAAKNALPQFEQELNRYENGPLDKLQGVQKRLMEYQHTVEFESLSIGEQDRIQELIKEAACKANILLVKIENDVEESKEKSDAPKFSSAQVIEDEAVFGTMFHEHNLQAEKFMEDAEGLFYSGRYADAISQYEKVLQIEPEWGRAKEHQGEAEEYLKKGTIPMEALPREAAILYGNAQSAARYGDYSRAKEMLNSAKQVLVEHKIMRWQEGANFEVQLDNNIAALDVAREADKLFRQGKFDEAIDKLETVASVTNNPTYKEKARNYQEFKEQTEALFMRLSGKPTLHLIMDATRDIESLEYEYGENSVFQQLRRQLDSFIKEKTMSDLLLLETSIQNSTRFNVQENPENAIFLDFLSGANVTIPDETTNIYFKILETNRQFAFQGYEAYARTVEALVLQYPLNSEILLRYEWINTKMRIEKSRGQRRKDSLSRILAFRLQAQVWFVVSILSAVALLAISIYVITLAVRQGDLWGTLTSFLSVLPVFASTLFYNQSLEANKRVEAAQEKMAVQEQDDIEIDRRMEQEMFNKLRQTNYLLKKE